MLVGFRNKKTIYLSILALVTLVTSSFLFLVSPKKILASPNAPLGTTAGVDGSVYTVAVTSTKIYIGGTFSHVGGQARNAVAALNLDGSLDTQWNPDISGTVNSIYATASAIYVGGSFNTVNGATTRNNAAAFQIANASNVGTVLSWDPNANGTVNKIIGSGIKIYLGGSFTTVDATTRFSLAAVDSTTGAVDASWDPSMGAYVQDLLIYNSKVYAVGAFSVANFGAGTQATRNYAANFNLANGSDVGAVQSWDPNLDSVAYAVAYYNNQIYLGGAFTQVGVEFLNHVARVDTTLGDTVDTTWDPGPDGNVFDITISSEGNIFLAGSFDNVFSSPHKYIALVNNVDGTPSAWDPNFTGGTFAYAVGISDSTAAVGGDFAQINGVATHANFAQFRFPKIQFTVTTSSEAEDVGTASIEVSQDIVSDIDTNFDIQVDGASTATPSSGRFPNDYTFIDSSPFTITAGLQTKNIDIGIEDDSDEEDDETIIMGLILYDPVFFATNTTHTFTILDNDTSAPPSFTITPISTNITEGGSTGSYSVVADQTPTSPPGCGVCVATFIVNISHDDQVTVDQDTLTFTAGNWDTPQTVVVTAVNDVAVEGDHSSVITHTVDDHLDAVISDITFNITDNDNPPHVGGGGGGCLSFCGFQNISLPTDNPSPPPVTSAPIEEPVVSPPNQNPNPPPQLPEKTREFLTLNLRRGQRNPQVQILQRFLNEHGFVLASSSYGSPGQETSLFGPRTYRALVKFQTANFEILHSISGKLDEATRNLINSLF